MMRVAVIGSTEQLGSDRVKVLEAEDHEVFPLSHPEIECTALDSARRAVETIRPSIVVNCAAFVRGDECEDRPEDAFRANAAGAFNVARTCSELNALCAYTSTDYVFDGHKEQSYTEQDTPRPINVYGELRLTA